VDLSVEDREGEAVGGQVVDDARGGPPGKLPGSAALPCLAMRGAVRPEPCVPASRRPVGRTREPAGPRIGKSVRVQPGSSYRQARQEAPIRRVSSPSAARPIRRCQIDQEFTNQTLSSLNIPKPSPLNPHSRPTATRCQPRGPAGHAARPLGLPTVSARGTCGDHGCAGTSPLPPLHAFRQVRTHINWLPRPDSNREPAG
jgi:hypothetical protein